jgi:BMFP domain-containing protein YqiC
MQPENKIFDDLSRIANGAIGAVAGMGREMEAAIRQRVEGYLSGLDLVKRDEFDAVKAMAEKARVENENLKARIAKLEAKS